jgi:SagB-type dehydrogenase family enzyme
VVAHSLQQLRSENLFSTLEPMFYTYPFMKNANVVIALAAVFMRTQSKYGPRGYRYILLEAGHVAQNICLRAMELGLESLCMGGFVDSALNGLLNLKLTEEGVVYTVAAGFA